MGGREEETSTIFLSIINNLKGTKAEKVWLISTSSFCEAYLLKRFKSLCQEKINWSDLVMDWAADLTEDCRSSASDIYKCIGGQSDLYLENNDSIMVHIN